jgi:hypothetical protein
MRDFEFLIQCYRGIFMNVALISTLSSLKKLSRHSNIPIIANESFEFFCILPLHPSYLIFILVPQFPFQTTKEHNNATTR